MNKVFDKARSAVATSAKKFTNVSVNRGKTAYPKASKDLENLGIRWHPLVQNMISIAASEIGFRFQILLGLIYTRPQ
jgi:hypothetical protein